MRGAVRCRALRAFLLCVTLLVGGRVGQFGKLSSAPSRCIEAGQSDTEAPKWLLVHSMRARQPRPSSLLNPRKCAMPSAACVVRKWSWPFLKEKQHGDRHAATAGILTMSTPRWCGTSSLNQSRCAARSYLSLLMLGRSIARFMASSCIQLLVSGQYACT